MSSIRKKTTTTNLYMTKYGKWSKAGFCFHQCYRVTCKRFFSAASISFNRKASVMQDDMLRRILAKFSKLRGWSKSFNFWCSWQVPTPTFWHFCSTLGRYSDQNSCGIWSSYWCISPSVGHRTFMKPKHPSNMSGAFLSWFLMCPSGQKQNHQRGMVGETLPPIKWILSWWNKCKQTKYTLNSQKHDSSWQVDSFDTWPPQPPIFIWPHIVPGRLPIAAPFSQARPQWNLSSILWVGNYFY